MKKWNHYKCPKCGGITVARHDNEGVTPFLLRCRVKDTVTEKGHRIHGCDGMAESEFFNGSQAENQTPHVIFYRPSVDVAIVDILKMPKQYQAGMLEHYKMGGSLLIEVEMGKPGECQAVALTGD